MNHKNFVEQLFDIQDELDFDRLALDLFRYQSENNKVYRSYIDLLHIELDSIATVDDIPYLPIEFFKSHEVVSGDWVSEKVFHSSGTTGQEVSKHLIKDNSLYERSFLEGFRSAYGDPKDFIFLFLLPNYQKNPHSSLIAMTDRLIEESRDSLSGYYLDQGGKLVNVIQQAGVTGKKVLLLGVSYALLDFAERTDVPDLGNVIIMETGGMKGNRKELVKEELHARLKTGFGVDEIHSEYGMTELQSQAYSKAGGEFHCPHWMRVSARDVNDPFKALEKGRSGGLNIIDLTNVHSCAFIATQDLGRVDKDGAFELLGRFDHSDIRGCNLLVVDSA
ncbi:MAG: acyl transferase [Flavobacteriales bacterium]|nr:acyl transferase [Flavobacteriales bacterium]